MSNQLVIPSYKNELRELVTQLEGMLPAEQFDVFNTDAENLATQYRSPLKLKQGEKAPGFTLPNALGELMSLEDLLSKGPVVLTFYRGAWCPYCNLQLRQLQQILPQLQDKSASLMAISPQSPDQSLDMKQKNALEFEVLTDAGNQVASQYTTVLKYGEAPLKAMAELGYDFNSFYEDESGEIPIPAIFVIRQNGDIVYAYSGGGDYRARAEPGAVLEALSRL